MWRKATYYRLASVAALVAASAIAMTRIAAAASITYDVNQTIGGGSVTGTITTDGFTGPLFTSDIVGFNLTTSVGGVTTTLMNGVNGGSVFLGGGGLNATPTELMFNFAGSGTFANFFASPGCQPVWTLRTTGGSACNGVSGIVNSVQAVAGGPIATVDMTGSGNEPLDQIPINPIPLPPAIYSFGSVLGGAFWLGRRKRSAVSGLGSA